MLGGIAASHFDERVQCIHISQNMHMELEPPENLTVLSNSVTNVSQRMTRSLEAVLSKMGESLVHVLPR